VFSTVPSVPRFCTPCSQDSNLCSMHTLLPLSYHLHTDPSVFHLYPRMLILLDSSTLADLPKVSSCISKLFRNRERSGHSPCLGVVGDQVIWFVCLLSPQHHAGSVRFIFGLLHKRWQTIKWDSVWSQMFTAVKFLFLFIQALLYLTPWCNSP